MDTLERSKETLQILHLDNVLGADVFHRATISNLCFKLPNLRDFRIRGGTNDWLSISLCLKASVQEEGKKGLALLKILWTWGTSNLLRENLGMLNSLVCLKIHSTFTEVEWREILDRPSKTLKHLDLESGFGRGSPSSTSLEFPHLKFLGTSRSLPRWMLMPSVEVLLCSSIPRGFKGASISELWINGNVWLFSNNSNGIGSGFPLLRKLVWKASRSLLEQMVERHGSEAGKFSFHPLLRQRREKVEAEHKIDGIRMRSLQVLIVSKIFYDFIRRRG